MQEQDSILRWPQSEGATSERSVTPQNRHRLTGRGGGGLAEASNPPALDSLSPFLSNLYLHRFDEACSHLIYFRYADGLLVLGRSWQEVIEARRHIRGLARHLGLRLKANKNFVGDRYKKPLVYLGYELRGSNIYPPEEAILRLRKNLEFRGIGDRKALMRDFVHRYRLGPVRKLFRRVDR